MTGVHLPGTIARVTAAALAAANVTSSNLGVPAANKSNALMLASRHSARIFKAVPNAIAARNASATPTAENGCARVMATERTMTADTAETAVSLVTAPLPQSI